MIELLVIILVVTIVVGISWIISKKVVGVIPIRSALMKTMLLIFSFVLILSSACYGLIYVTIGPFSYESGAKRFYKTHKDEVHEFVQLYEELSKKQGFSISKDGGNGINLRLYGAKVYGADRHFKDPNDPELYDLVRSEGIDALRFNMLVDKFNELNLVEIGIWPDEMVLIDIKDLFFIRRAGLIFCINDQRTCGFGSTKMIDTGVYYVELSNP